MNAIAINRLNKTYTKEKVHAVIDLSINVDEGRIFGLLGPNGAGKTTTIKILLGYILDFQGEVRIFDKNLKINLTELKQQIGYVPEGASLPKNLRVVSLLTTSARMYGIKDVKGAIDRVLAITGMTEYRNRKLGHMSKGQKQRISIANALIHAPKLLILDEPTSGLDALSRHKLLAFIRKWATETHATVIMSSHVLSEIDSICDEVAILNRGRLLFIGTQEELRKRFVTTSYIIQAKNVTLEDFQSLEYVKKVIQHANGNESLEVELTDIEKGAQSLLALLVKKNAVVTRFTLEEPTLETAFTEIVEADNHEVKDNDHE